MNGIVDEFQRALIDVLVAAENRESPVPLTAWIDTAFNGSLVIPRAAIAGLGLKQASTTQAILADGRVADLETFTCYLHWFGDVYRTQVVANDGEYPLLGTTLLANRRIAIDYRLGLVELEYVMLASGAPALLFYWFVLWNTAPYWPSLATTIVFAIKSNDSPVDKLRWQIQLLAMLWISSLLLHLFVWQPYVMDW